MDPTLQWVAEVEQAEQEHDEIHHRVLQDLCQDQLAEEAPL